MRDDYNKIKTEVQNLKTTNIDKMSTLEMVQVINNEDKGVALAVEKQLPNIVTAIDSIAAAMEKGGSLIYIGAGTSGRLGIVDASECPPTFGVDHRLVRGIIAGGKEAMFRAIEGAEDNEQIGKDEIDKNGIVKQDVVVGLSAAGRAPYVLGALKRAKEIGAITIGITCNPNSLLQDICDITIAPDVGPEVICGSTRMKAGTAQKLVLNMLSTGAMVKTGKVWGNLMINVSPSNEKLQERSIHILMEITGVERSKAEIALKTQGNIKAAIEYINNKL